MENQTVDTTPDYLRGQAQKEQQSMNSDLLVSTYGEMEAQIHIDMIVRCSKCRAQYRKTIKFYSKGQEITMGCEDCGRIASAVLKEG